MFTFFSVDDHVVEPRDVWFSRVPQKFKHRAPHVIEDGEREWWIMENELVPTMGLNAVAGKPREQWQHEPTRFSDMIPGCYEPISRAHDMLADGIVASLCFPTLPRFGGGRFAQLKDKELAHACVVAYNDWMIDEWCPSVPDMFVPMGILPFWDPPAAAAELRRCIDKGARAVAMPEETSQIGCPSYFTDFYDPIWEVAQEADLPICLHVGSSGTVPFAPPGAPYSVSIALAQTQTTIHSVAMMMGPIPRKFPDIKLVYSEGGIGWVPSALERADRQYDRHKYWSNLDDLLPSEVCRRNMWFCMIEEPDGLTERYKIGLDKIMWECDYPHADTSWPSSQENAAFVFKGVPQEEIDQITRLNAERLFRFPIKTVDEIAATLPPRPSV